MSSNSKIKVFQRAIARKGMFFSAWLFEKLPYWLVKQITHVFLFIGFKLTMRHRKIAKESLGIAFGDSKTEDEINGIIKKCFASVGRGMIELFYFMAHPAMIDSRVEVKGIEHLEEAMSLGKGVVAVTAHFGNFPLMMLYFARKGYDTNCIMRHTRDHELDKFLYKKREIAGLKTIYTKPRTKCVGDSIKILRRNGLLFIPIDQHFGGDGGVYVDFFGQKAATATGPVVFASRTDSVILPMFIVRKGEDSHEIIIEKPLQVIKKETEQETLEYNMAIITALVEKYARLYPHEWAWMHRRWKK